MSTDDIKRGIRKMTDSGELDHATAKEALARPLEGETIVRLYQIERETQRQSTALFGDIHLNGGVNRGLVRDVRDLKLIIFKAVWSISGVVAFCTFVLALVGLWAGLRH